MLRQIKMFRLDQATLDEVNTFLDELNESEAAEIDVQIVASSDANSPAMTASPAATSSSSPAPGPARADRPDLKQAGRSVVMP